jgi:hypothetical protein
MGSLKKDILSLYKQLTQLEYRVWLNIFHMGGGDSLFVNHYVFLLVLNLNISSQLIVNMNYH